KNLKSGSLDVDSNADGVADIVFSKNARLGISTTSPAANVHVVGNVLVGDWLLMPELLSVPPSGAGLGSVYMMDGNLYFQDAVGSSTDLTGGLSIWSGSGGNVYRSSGRVGMGEASPNMTLDIAGSAIVSGQLLLASASAAAPALSFSSEPDSGLFLGSAGNLSFALGGTPLLCLNSSNIHLQGVDLRTDAGSFSATVTAVGLEVFGQGTLSHTGGEEGWHNTALGWEALKKCGTGSHNTAAGEQALNANTSGSYNLALGLKGLLSNTTGSRNVAIGFWASEYNISGGNNTAVGRDSLVDNKAFNNTALGYGCLDENILGTHNSSAGVSNMGTGTTGSRNTSVGGQTLVNSRSNNNTAAGYFTLNSQPTGEENPAVGIEAMRTVIAASNCMALGYQAGRNGSGIDSVAVGYHSSLNDFGERNTTVGNDSRYLSTGPSNDNAIFGQSAGYNLSTGDNNLLLGKSAGESLTSGSNNIIIGYYAAAPSATSMNQLVIGINGSMTVHGDMDTGNVGIGTMASAYKLQVAGNARTSEEIFVNGNIMPDGNVTYSLGTSSLAFATTYSQDIVVI
ncbi:MAG: hypothetical protein HQL31_14165, partial [Planctomycetes bacterium]|nr:hypothetical protein [Planctomycetota bacterium]